MKSHHQKLEVTRSVSEPLEILGSNGGGGTRSLLVSQIQVRLIKEAKITRQFQFG